MSPRKAVLCGGHWGYKSPKGRECPRKGEQPSLGVIRKGGESRGRVVQCDRVFRVLSQLLRHWVSEDRDDLWRQNRGCIDGSGLVRSRTGVGVRRQENRDMGHLLTSLCNQVPDMTQVATGRLGSMTAKRSVSISSWVGSRNGKGVSVGKLVESNEAWSFQSIALYPVSSVVMARVLGLCERLTLGQSKTVSK